MQNLHWANIGNNMKFREFNEVFHKSYNENMMNSRGEVEFTATFVSIKTWYEIMNDPEVLINYELTHRTDNKFMFKGAPLYRVMEDGVLKFIFETP